MSPSSACSLASRSSPSFIIFNNLATAMWIRFEQLGRMEDLEACHRQALALRPHGHPDRPLSLTNFATVVSNHYKQLGRMEDYYAGEKEVL